MTDSFAEVVDQPGNPQLPHIPNEIYLEIVNQLHEIRGLMSEAQYRSTLLSLSLACRFFRAPCLPFRFESIHDLGGHIHHLDAGFHTWRRGILAKEARSLEYARYVKAYTMGGLPEDRTLLIPELHFTESIEALNSFVNLQSLSFSRLHTDWPILSSILHLQQLRTITIEYCSHGSSFAHWVNALNESSENVPRTIPPWTSITVNGDMMGDDLAVIRSLGRSNALREFCTNSVINFMAYATIDAVRNLRKLELDTDSFDTLEHFSDLWRFLEAYTPKLEHLTLRGSYDIPRPDNFSFASSSSFHLKTLHCPLEFLPRLVHGRPLIHVSIDLEPLSLERPTIGDVVEVENYLRNIKLQDLQIIGLQTPAWLCKIAPLEAYFPNLQDLTIRMHVENVQRIQVSHFLVHPESHFG